MRDARRARVAKLETSISALDPTDPNDAYEIEMLESMIATKQKKLASGYGKLASVYGDVVKVSVSITAITIADAIRIRRGDSPEYRLVGNIVLTTTGQFCVPDPDRLFLSGGSSSNYSEADSLQFVHRQLMERDSTRTALENFGLRSLSKERMCEVAISKVLSGVTKSVSSADQENLWYNTRDLDPELVVSMIHEYSSWLERLRVLTYAGEWRQLHSVLLPGRIVPGDRSRDEAVTVDVDFHKPDLDLLGELNVSNRPRARADLRADPELIYYQDNCAMTTEVSLVSYPSPTRNI